MTAKQQEKLLEANKVTRVKTKLGEVTLERNELRNALSMLEQGTQELSDAHEIMAKAATKLIAAGKHGRRNT